VVVASDVPMPVSVQVQGRPRTVSMAMGKSSLMARCRSPLVAS
jgi:hypothetical protein